MSSRHFPRIASLAFLVSFGAIGAVEAVQYALREPGGFSDFFGLWSWSRFVAVNGTTGLYAAETMHAFQRALDPLYASEYYPYLYPPTYLLLIWPLGHLPIAWARWVWSTLTLAAFLGAVLAPRPRAGLAAAALVAPATVLCLICGQNGLLSAALMVGGLRCARARPLLAGLLLGLLSYKPHLALLIPVALAAAGLWRALGASALCAAAGVALSASVFGLQTWRDWIAARAASWSAVDGFIGSHAALIPTPAAALRLLGASPSLCLAGQGLALLAAAAAVWVAWRRGRSALVVTPLASLLATPYAFLYDLPLAAAAALIGLGEHVPRPTTLLPLGAVLVLPQLMFTLSALPIPIGAPILAVALLWLLWSAGTATS